MNDLHTRKREARSLLSGPEHLLADYERLMYVELCLSVLVSEHDNGGSRKDDYLISELKDCLRGGPYERLNSPAPDTTPDPPQ